MRDIVIVWRAFGEDTAMELYEVCVGTAQDAGDICNCTVVHPQPTMEFAIAEHLKGSADQDVAQLQTAIVSGTCVCAFCRWALVWRAYHSLMCCDVCPPRTTVHGMNHAGLWATAYSRPVFVDPSPAQLPCDDEGNSRIAGTWCDEPIVKIVAQDTQAVRVPHTPSATKAEVYTGAIRATVAAFDSQPPILEQSEAKSHSIKVLMQRLTARSGVFYEAAVSKEPTCRTTSQAYAPIDAGEGGVAAAIAVVVRVEQLTHKQTVYACLKATTRAGVVALHASQGVIVDATPPRLASLDGHVVSDLPPTRSPSDNDASGQVPMLPPPLGQGGDIDVDVTAVPGNGAIACVFTVQLAWLRRVPCYNTSGRCNNLHSMTTATSSAAGAASRVLDQDKGGSCCTQRHVVQVAGLPVDGHRQLCPTAAAAWAVGGSRQLLLHHGTDGPVATADVALVVTCVNDVDVCNNGRHRGRVGSCCSVGVLSVLHDAAV